MNNQQLQAFIHAYLDKRNKEVDSPSDINSFADFMIHYSQRFGVDISSLDINSYTMQTISNNKANFAKKEMTSPILLYGIEKGYLDNEIVDLLASSGQASKMRLSPKQIAGCVIIVLVASILLGIFAIYI